VARFDLAEVETTATTAYTDTLVNIENVAGSGKADTITGDANANFLSGLGGNDTLKGSAGKDTMDGGDGIDTASYDIASVAMVGGVNVDLGAGTASTTFAGTNVSMGGTSARYIRIYHNDEYVEGPQGHELGLTGMKVYDAGGNDVAFGLRSSIGADGNANGAANPNNSNWALTDATVGGGWNGQAGDAGTVAYANTGFGGAKAYIQLDLGSAQAIGSISLWGDAGWAIDSKNLRVYVSNTAFSAATTYASLAADPGVARFDLAGVETSATTTYTSTLANIENATGSGRGDTLTGNANANVLSGLGGNDTLNGGAGNDMLDGGAGNDMLNGGADDDTLYGSAGYDTMDGGPGSNTADYSAVGPGCVNASLVSGIVYKFNASGTGYTTDAMTNIQNLVGTAWADALAGNEGSNVLYGGAGTDYLTGAGGNDVLDGGDGADNLYGDGGDDVVYGGGGNDTIHGDAGTDALIGGTGSDTYIFQRGGGMDAIQENDSTAGNTDRLQFQGYIYADQLWFEQSGNDLKVSVIGTADKTVVQNWYLGTAYHVEQIQADDGKLLLDTQVQNLVQAMAAFAPPPMGQTTLTSQQQTALAPVLAANWH
jgi:Ca2+-binding RTX toxin-like protein